ncbi:hypothetical protein ACIRBX_26785 [Kitasatospora sp. NPDC096147]|uniref:hypothetical protein n=1 Tax=Kitasatospora sp. NPDC096147 TaxID=3364093 RepID=UPI00380281F6
MRRLALPARALPALLLTTALGLAAAPAAHAAPGDNGTVKIHKSTTATTDPSDEPKVCKFYVAGLNFDSIQLVTYSISKQPDDGNPDIPGQVVLASGQGRSIDYALPDGQYKLEWTFAGENGKAKQKVFKVDCPPGSDLPISSAPTGKPTPTPSASSSAGTGAGGGSGTGSDSLPVGGVDAGGGGSWSGPNAAEIAGGSALLIGAAAVSVRHLRRRAARHAEG